MPAASFDPVDFLRRHDLTAQTALHVEPLSGGYLNAVYRVRGDGLDWVVKRFAESAELTLFPNLPDAEHLALHRLAGLQAAPRPIAFVSAPSSAPVLVYEFWRGGPWDGDLPAVAGLLRRIRSTDAIDFRTVPMLPHDILRQGDTFLPLCGPSDQTRLAAVRPAAIDVPAVRPSLIHTDFGPGNLIGGTVGLIAIDWQCPAAGDPIEDLAAFLSPAFQILYGRKPLHDAEEQIFLAAYDDDEAVTRLHLLRGYYDWRMAAYCAMRAVQLAVTRPEAAARYRAATAALLARLEAGR